MHSAEMIESPLKYAGSKKWMLPFLDTTYSQHRHRRLVETCVGGLNVVLGLRPMRAILCDANPHLVNFYRQLQATPFTIDLMMSNEESRYYAARDRFNEVLRSGEYRTREMAALFYFLNRTCFNGLLRFSKKKGEFNVPFGKYKKINYRTDFSEYHSALAGWEFVDGDFELIQERSDDFIYIDPPYDGVFASYTPEGFSWEDQVRLAKRFARHPGPVIASNAATDRVLNLYRGLDFKITIADAPRSISSDGDRATVREMIAVKNL